MLHLQEATELSALFLRVENVFASGDVPAIASTLATMRRSLILIGDVPEFRGGLQKLEVCHLLSETLRVSQLATNIKCRKSREGGLLICTFPASIVLICCESTAGTRRPLPGAGGGQPGHRICAATRGGAPACGHDGVHWALCHCREIVQYCSARSPPGDVAHINIL